MLKEKLLSLIVGMDSFSKEEIKTQLKTIILLKEIVDDEVHMFNNTQIKGICCLPSICLKNKCDVDIDSTVEL